MARIRQRPGVFQHGLVRANVRDLREIGEIHDFFLAVEMHNLLGNSFDSKMTAREDPLTVVSNTLYSSSYLPGICNGPICILIY